MKMKIPNGLSIPVELIVEPSKKALKKIRALIHRATAPTDNHNIMASLEETRRLKETGTSYSRRAALLGGMALGAMLMASPAAADTIFTAYSFNATSGTTPRTMPDRIADIRNVKDFGAVGNGIADDRAAIQACINAAATSGVSIDGIQTGAIVFFPPGVYLIGSPGLSFAALGNSSIHLVGSGLHCCALTGNFAGFIIDKRNDNAQNLEGIEGLTVKNYSTSVNAGAIQINSAQGCVVKHCLVTGYVGIDNSANAYCTTIYTCVLSGLSERPAGSTGIFATQTTIIGTRVQGFDVGIQAWNAGFACIGCACETCNTAFILGIDRGNAFTASISGTTMDVTELFWGAGILDGVVVSGIGVTSATVVKQLTETGTQGPGKTGTYQISVSQNVSSRTMTTPQAVSNMSGFVINGFQTERCGAGIYVFAGTGGLIGGITLTGSIGPGLTYTNITWSGGTATINLPTPHGQPSGTRNIKLEGSGSYNGDQVGTFVSGGSTITFTSANFGTVSAGTWSFRIQHGIRMRGCTNVIILCPQNGINPAPEQAYMDLAADGNTSGTNNVLIGVNGSFIMPPANSKASYTYIACNGANFDPSIAYADRPGASGVYETTPKIGMMYNFNNANSVAWGTAITGGGGTTNVLGRYNGTAWTVVGI